MKKASDGGAGGLRAALVERTDELQARLGGLWAWSGSPAAEDVPDLTGLTRVAHEVEATAGRLSTTRAKT